MISCREFTQSLTQYMEGQLPAGGRMGIVMHSLMCSHCRRYARQVRLVVSLSSRASNDELPESDSGTSLEPAKREDELVNAFSRRHRGVDS